MPLDDMNWASYVDQSPSLLAQQPLTVKDTKSETKKWEAYFNHCQTSLASMRVWRWSWWQHWAQCAEFFLPKRYIWLVTANRMNRGSPINDAIVDTTGTQAMRVCSSGMYSGITNPARPWIKLEPAITGMDIPPDGKIWLEDTEEKLYTVLASSNFYTQMAQAFEDLTVFGTSPIIIYEDFQDIIRLYVPCAGEYFLRASARQDTDTLAREFTQTVRQIVDMFQLENCPDVIKKAWREGGASLDGEYVVAHIIEPNYPVPNAGTNEAAARVVSKEYVFREVYWLRDLATEKALSLRGFMSRPFIAMMWSKTANNPYGRGPCMDALGDVKQLQLETRRKAEFIEKLVRPPMGASPELKNNPTSIIPGQVTYFSTENGRKGFFPLFEVNPAALAPMVQDLEMVRGRLKTTLFVDVFMAITQMAGVQPRNQLELTKRDLERLQQLGPVIELVEGQLSVAIQRILDIMQRRGILAPKPKSLDPIQLKIGFVSMMRIAQRQAQAVSVKDTLQLGGGLSSAAKAAGMPDPLRKINLDKTLERYATLNDFWSDCIYSDEEVKAHDAERARGEAAAQAPQLAMAGVNAAKTLSQTELPGGNALAALLGQQGQ